MTVILIILYILIVFIVMTVWFIVDSSENEDGAVMFFSLFWPITILVVTLMQITQISRILARKIRKKYVSNK